MTQNTINFITIGKDCTDCSFDISADAENHAADIAPACSGNPACVSGTPAYSRNTACCREKSVFGPGLPSPCISAPHESDSTVFGRGFPSPCVSTLHKSDSTVFGHGFPAPASLSAFGQDSTADISFALEDEAFDKLAAYSRMEHIAPEVFLRKAVLAGIKSYEVLGVI